MQGSYLVQEKSAYLNDIYDKVQANTSLSVQVCKKIFREVYLQNMKKHIDMSSNGSFNQVHDECLKYIHKSTLNTSAIIFLLC